MSGPGWYLDPNSSFEYRFFDGRSWTAHVTLSGREVIDPAGGVVAPPPRRSEEHGGDGLAGAGRVARSRPTDPGPSGAGNAPPDVFISYAREDEAIAEALGTELRALGWVVWSDNRIAVSVAFDDAIQVALDQARCVVVIWSPASVSSQWVRAEAAEGVAHDKLVQVSFHAGLPLPIQFRQISMPTLTSVRLDPNDPNAAGFVSAIAQRVGRSPDGWSRGIADARSVDPGIRAVTAGNWELRAHTRAAKLFKGSKNLRLFPDGSAVGDSAAWPRKWRTVDQRHRMRGRWRYDLATSTLQLDMSGMQSDLDAMSTVWITISRWLDADNAECQEDGMGRWTIRQVRGV